MKFIPAIACVAALFLVSGCARMKVSCEIEPAFDFGQIRTYQWIDPPQEILDLDNTFLNKDLQRALNNELAARGWEQVLNAGNATVQITCYIQITEHEEYVEPPPQSESNFAGALTYKKGDWSYVQLEPDRYAYTIETGFLNMTVTDTASNQRVWQGILKTKLDRSTPVEKQYELFQLAARKLMKQLP